MPAPATADVAAVISAVAGLGSFAAVGLGVWVAYSQLTIWRNEAVARRRAEVATSLLVSAYDATDALNGIRHLMESIPEGSKSTQAGVLENKWKRFQASSQVFEDLRKQQILAKALFDSDDIDQAVRDIFAVRQDVWAAILTLSWRPDEELDRETLIFYRDLKMSLYKTDGERDTLSMKQREALSVLDAHLIPFIRYESRD